MIFRQLQLTIGALLLAAAGTLSAEDCEEGYCINWYTIASGGEMLSADDPDNPEWQLSGTVGQWEATEGRELSGGDWDLTGGFWGLTLEQLRDLLFHDRFEEE